MSATEDRPLVSFLLFAYKQEEFIREAVAGAFSQTYSPLEIILSDDCSPDRTFEIMQEMAAAYRGSHRIVLNRNQTNLGIGAHVNHVMTLASGQWIVPAAGDDISLPTRVEKLVGPCLQQGRVMFNYCEATKIDESGAVIGTFENPKPESFTLQRMARENIGVLGATLCWHRSLYDRFGPMDPAVIQEDNVLPFRALLTGEMRSISDELVLYRIHSGNISSAAGKQTMKGKSQWYKTHYIRMMRNRVAVWQTKLNDLKKVETLMKDQGIEMEPLLSEIEKNIKIARCEQVFTDGKILDQMKAAAIARSNGVQPLQLLRWVLYYRFPRVTVVLSEAKRKLVFSNIRSKSH